MFSFDSAFYFNWMVVAIFKPYLSPLDEEALYKKKKPSNLKSFKNIWIFFFNYLL